MVACHSRHLELQSSHGSLRRISQRRYGDNAVDFYLNEVESE